jgi:hypothetical protein
MPDLISLFKTHIDENIFETDAEFVSDSVNKIRINQLNRNSTKSYRYKQSIVLIFEQDVIKKFEEAYDLGLMKGLEKYKYSLRKFLVASLSAYDPDGYKGSAFKISIDSRATDF